MRDQSYSESTQKQELFKARVRGGLGNQLFKVAAGIHIGNISRKKLVLDIGWYRYQKGNSELDRRKFELDYFPEIKKIEKINSSFVGSFLLRATKEKQRKLRGQGIVVTEHNYAEQLEENFRRASISDDSFEDLKYLPTPESLIRYFSFPQNKSDWLNSEIKKLGSGSNLAIHVRMGDYLNFPLLYDTVDLSYYLNSIREYQSRQSSFSVTLFSDSPTKAIDFLDSKIKIDNIQYSDWSVSSAETFELLSNFDGIIAANSTFSWWAGYLGTLNGTCDFVSLPSHFLRDIPINDKLGFARAHIISACSNLKFRTGC